MAKEDLQNQFLRELVESQQEVSIFMLNGIKLQGKIDGFDQFAVFLTGNNRLMIYKNSIATVLPATEARQQQRRQHDEQPA